MDASVNVVRGRALAVVTVGLAAFCISLSLSSSAGAAVSFQSSFGGAGTGAGKFSGPTGVAVNDTTGDIYVSDPALNRVQQFTANGIFIRTWGQGVDENTGGNVCTALSAHVCKAGGSDTGSGGFSGPHGIAVDNSGGPDNGSVYVQDRDNNRVQKFTADGEFVLMWGKGVNLDTGGNICTAASGDVCKAGGTSGSTTPFVPSANGEFAGWAASPPAVAVDGAGYVYVGDPKAVPYPRVQKFDASGTFVAQIAGAGDTAEDRFNGGGIEKLLGMAVDSAGDAFISNIGRQLVPNVFRFDAADFTFTGETAFWDRAYDSLTSSISGAGNSIQGVAIDPENDYVFIADKNSTDCASGAGGFRILEFHPDGQRVDCTKVVSPTIASVGGIAISSSHRLYIAEPEQKLVHVFSTPVATVPTVTGESVTEITSTTARINGFIAGNIDDTTYHIEHGTSPCSLATCQSTVESTSIGASTLPVPINRKVGGLEPGATNYYRVVATNGAGTTVGPDHEFGTFDAPTLDPSCHNSLARQQTGSALLLDCRAYELVSAGDQGGYNVESSLIPGQVPFAGFPQADGRALYATHNGGIPGAGNPTNRGPDPYVATRDPDTGLWSTKYVGIPADAPSAEPFSSTLADADSMLTRFAFGGSDICDPCFADGTAGLPLRGVDGTLGQGMVGSIAVADPEPAGELHKQFSADGSHFLFGSLQQFEPAGNSNGTDVTIYDRDLDAGTTQVASTLPSGETIADGENVAVLDISDDGSRILIGDLVSTDAAGNRYWDLYMHVGGAPASVEIADTPSGVSFGGMTGDGTKVYFSSRVQLTGDDSDSSVDLFRADVDSSSAAQTRVSAGSDPVGDTDSCDPSGNSYNTSNWNTIKGGPTDCSIVMIGGTGGVSGDGTVYFLSPETLDSNGAAGAPNLFLARPGESPVYVATLESSASQTLDPASPRFDHYFGSFVKPVGAAIDRSDGSFYVYDTNNAETTPTAYVQKFDSSGTPVSGFGASSKLENLIATSSFPAGFQPVGMPNAIAVDNNPASINFRDLYVPEGGTGALRRYNSSGGLEFSIAVGNPSVYPTSVGIHPVTGALFVGRTSIFPVPAQIRRYNAAGAPEAPAFFSVAGPAFGVAVDSAGKVYVATGSGGVLVYSSTGVPDSKPVLDPSTAYGVSVDPNNYANLTDDVIYVDRGDRVVAYDMAGAPLASPQLGVVSGSMSLGTSSNEMVVSNPTSGNVAIFKPDVPTNRGYDNPLVIDSVRDADGRRAGEFQVTPDGETAVFSTTLPLTGFAAAKKYEIFRYDATGDDLQCVSCDPTGAPPSADASLTDDGLSVSDDGRVFFNSPERLVERDTNSKGDVYEWSDGKVELISTGTSSFDSGLLTAGADGKNVFFFTRDTLASSDQNGNLMKLYTAREGGGFFAVPPPPPCAASDECHGRGTEAAAPVGLGSMAGSGGNVPPTVRCRKGFVKRSGKCIKRKKHRRNSRNGHHG